eukprot:NODE_5256_length_964_cov_122.596908_g5041_i0.p1 GENE.NODE_5256_length_964_cov_122.596908_g5041_i0~~NODE_5256_length_964_cov_122.596908_g5041_i0.p1  ORF type:complete len:280 (-),score=54.57 NODE_5256_length_964_cov_122.596908_g5041_i0:24-863(-)
MEPVMNPYAILGVKQSASMEDIKTAFRKRALETHPDKEAGDDTMFKQVNSAYHMLADPTTKAKYDNNAPKTKKLKKEKMMAGFASFGTGAFGSPSNSNAAVDVDNDEPPPKPKEPEPEPQPAETFTIGRRPRRPLILDPHPQAGGDMENLRKKSLYNAIIFNEPEKVRDIMEQMNNINAPISKGQTPLVAAIQSGYPDVVRILLSNPKVDPLQADAMGEAPVSHAVVAPQAIFTMISTAAEARKEMLEAAAPPKPAAPVWKPAPMSKPFVPKAPKPFCD